MTSMRRRLSRAQCRQQLLETAESLFAAHGYGAATMRNVARDGGVTRAFVCEKFSSPEDIRVEGTRRADGELKPRLALLATETDVAASIEDVAETSSSACWRVGRGVGGCIFSHRSLPPRRVRLPGCSRCAAR
ncbi:TetR/AcrR family transcriptional regulator [Microbacterium sp. AGC85]